ncbi:metallophosphoesterase [Halococcus sp. PRR34]|uniref:metallophosphoesterase family protein n=1 Tax=Halococcus sp. PRR34 TaxID=3020830 RepID=UPI00236188E8|nr:metallophosphoesterase [Halococcus sp. PRR34]
MAIVLHTADTHLGYSQYHSEVREADFAAAFETVIDEAIDNDVDAVVHSGDLFHHSRPDVTTLADTLRQLQRLDDAEIPFLGVVGNHEGTTGDQWVDIFDQLRLGIRLGREPTVIDDTAFYGLDHVSPARRSSLEYDFEPHDAEYAILVGHGLFSPVADGGRWPLQEVIEASSVRFDGFLLGDDHMPHVQVVRDATVTYPGSTDRTQSDQRAPRGFNMVMTGVNTEAEAVPTPDGGAETPVGLAPTGPEVAERDADVPWPVSITEAREEGIRRAIEGPHGEPPVLVERREMRTRPFRYLSVTLEEDEGAARVRDEIDDADLTGAVTIIHISGTGDPVLAANIEEYVRDVGAMTARVNDTRVFGSEEDTDDVSFADPEAAVESRLREMRLSGAGHDIERRIREQDTPTTSMADAVEGDVDDRIKDDPDQFIRQEPEVESESEDEAETGTNAGIDTGADDVAADDGEGSVSEASELEAGTEDEIDDTDMESDGDAAEADADPAPNDDAESPPADASFETGKDDAETGKSPETETVADTEDDAVSEGEPNPEGDYDDATEGEETDEQTEAEADGEDEDAQQVTLDDRWGD